jgi:valyl-tRNA synthetase
MELLDKSYSPKELEKRIYDLWMENGYFRASDQSDKEPFCIVMPPPNVTGSLHMGHALTATIQDLLIRFKRMSGYNSLWLPGTDHAGIATQNVVEREIAREGKTRYDLGREKFIEKVWEWKKIYHSRITEQHKRLGVSCDWDRERFTMDEGLSRAVREVFIRLYNEGLIYRGKKLINFCPHCETALSDLEVVHEEEKGHLWYIRYPAEDNSEGVIVATTRPETMLGDTAVAVNPSDSRFDHLTGKKVILPLTGRTIPVIQDPLVDREFGTGAVKITPGHDFNDFEIGLKHGLPLINIFRNNGKLLERFQVFESAGKKWHLKLLIENKKYADKEILDVRKEVIKDLEDLGLLIRIEDHQHAVGHCYRCRTVVEPTFAKQWFVKVGNPQDEKSIAGAAVKAVKDLKIKILPEGWEKTYFAWMENIKDWCISRHIWWGHRIPVYCCEKCMKKVKEGIIQEEDLPVYVGHKPPARCDHCGTTSFLQEEDVLDTWFSSALWPFSTLGWPDSTPALRTFYPNTVMETGFDILFFWVARMIMMGMKFMGDVPFRYVYLHAMIRDECGQKMSKTKGNVVDPLEIISEHGADALRFTLVMLTAQGREIKLSLKKIEGYRAFMNKIWNAARFIMMNMPDWPVSDRKAPENASLSISDKWILEKLNAATAGVKKALEEFRFNDAASLLYQFTWHTFCDWYVESSKGSISKGGKEADAARMTLVYVFERLLRLLHPFIPFITEEIWKKLPGNETGSIMVSRYPEPENFDFSAEASLAEIINSHVAAIRTIRGSAGIKPQEPISAIIKTSDESIRELLLTNSVDLIRLCRLERLTVDPDSARPDNSAISVLKNSEIYIPLSKDKIESEILRVQKEMKKIQTDLDFLNRKLSNDQFIANAPEEVIEETREKTEDLKEKHAALTDALSMFFQGSQHVS